MVMGLFCVPVERRFSVRYHFGVWKQTKSGVWVPKRLFAETAARPHWITIVSPIIAVGVALSSFGSYQVARQALNTSQQALKVSQQTLKVGQRAYLSVVEVKYIIAEPNIHGDDTPDPPYEFW
jgi:hypothetical protein